MAISIIQITPLMLLHLFKSPFLCSAHSLTACEHKLTLQTHLKHHYLLSRLSWCPTHSEEDVPLFSIRTYSITPISLYFAYQFTFHLSASCTGSTSKTCLKLSTSLHLLYDHLFQSKPTPFCSCWFQYSPNLTPPCLTSWHLLLLSNPYYTQLLEWSFKNGSG